MTTSFALTCDGCGQEASQEHIARRLRRLEWATRYRPVHINTLLLGAASPPEETDFFYSPQCALQGETARLLEAAGISFDGKTTDGVHAEFQRDGFFLTHVLECPLEEDSGRVTNRSSLLTERLSQRLPAMAARIRRSLKPKRVVLVSRALDPIVTKITAETFGCRVMLDEGRAFALDGADAAEAVVRLRTALAVVVPG
jgi:hypothetical protein